MFIKAFMALFRYFIIAFLFLPIIVIAQRSLEGTWKMVDDRTGLLRLEIEIEKENDGYSGTVVRLNPSFLGDASPLCSWCPGEYQNKAIIGMKLFRDWSENTYPEILDIESGTLFRLNLMQSKQDILTVYYFSGILGAGRTQYWYRKKAASP
jgi:hypothetical protein